MAFKSFREESRLNWGVSDLTPDNDQIKLGALLRIADSCELMAKDRQQMERNLKWHEEHLASRTRECDRLARSNAALRGVISRMKKQRP